MVPLRVTRTVLALPAAPPKPPTDALMSELGPVEATDALSASATLMPPLPPPPPIDCASTPTACAPSVTGSVMPSETTLVIEPVQIAPVESTVTLFASPAAPPKPPSEAEIDDFAAPFGSSEPVNAPAKLKPPLPPPPPIDCARMPFAPSPCVAMLSTLVTLTVEPLPAAPPKPPTLTAIAALALVPAIETLPEKPPAPPPPPTDCAKMPVASAPVV